MPENASLLRRLAAITYDAFLIVAIWMISTMVVVAVFTDGDAATGLAFQLLLYLELGAFYCYFWHKKGQTLGMQVWKIRTVSDTGELLELSECLARFAAATVSVFILGLGFVVIAFRRDKLALHDIASGSKVVFLGKDAYVD